MDPLDILTQTKENLFQNIDEVKKAQSDFQLVIKAAINFRQQLLALHEAGNKFIAELKKVGDNPVVKKNRWATEFSSRSRDQEQIENSSFAMQTKLWDKFILPSMNAAEKDKQEISATEKKLKTLSQSIEGDLKKIKKQKGALSQTTEGVRELISRHDELTSYFGSYKQRFFHKYVKACAETFLAQKEHYSNCLGVLKGESWKVLLAVGHAPLPDIGVVGSAQRSNTSPGTPPSNSGSSGTIPVISNVSSNYSSFPSPYNNAVKCGYLTKRGAQRKSWKKRFFVLTPDSLYYFENDISVKANREPLGSVLISMCNACQVNTSMKKSNCFELVSPQRTFYMYSDTSQDCQDWIEAVSPFIYTTNSTPYLLDAVAVTGSDAEGEVGSMNRDSVELEPPNDDLPLPPPDEQPSFLKETQPIEWEPVTTADGKTYYFNPVTRETRWDLPSS